MTITVYLKHKLAAKLDAYRKKRREERGGRVLTYSKAVEEIMETFLSGEPLQETVAYDVLCARVQELERRMQAVESVKE